MKSESLSAPRQTTASQLTGFTEFCEARTGQRGFSDPAALHAFSVGEYRRFWWLFLEWSQPSEGDPEPVCTEDRSEAALLPEPEAELRGEPAGPVARGGRAARTSPATARRAESLTRRELREGASARRRTSGGSASSPETG